MRVLFWVEPLIEMERPRFKQAWASDFSVGLMRALCGSDGGRRHRLVLAAGDAIAAECEVPAGTSLVAVDSLGLQRAFGAASALEITCGMYDGSLAGDALDAPAALIRSALGDFDPELVITHSPAPHVARAYPDALLLHREYSLFSRKPYPRTWYFDPCGMYRDSFLARFAGEIEGRQATEREKLERHAPEEGGIERRSLPTEVDVGQQHAPRPAGTGRWQQPTESELERLRRFREHCRALLRRRSPLRAFLANCRERFSTLLLFPLQFFGYYAIDANSPCADQLALLLYVLERVPRDAGLIVTSHPEHNRLDAETVEWLRRRHPNLLHHPEIEATYAPSQYLLPEVDGLVCLSSALGLQALFWGVPLISVGPCYETLADAALPDLRGVPERGSTGREALAYYLLTRFSVPERFLHAPNWASAFFARSLERWRAGGVDAGFCDAIAPADELFAHFEASLDGSIPHGCGTPSLERLHRVRRELDERIDRVPTGETAVEHGVEEAIASALTAPGPDALAAERRQLERTASHLERMAAWARENLRLLGEASAATAESTSSTGESTPPTAESTSPPGESSRPAAKSAPPTALSPAPSGSARAAEASGWAAGSAAAEPSNGTEPPAARETARLREVLERISRTAEEDPQAAATLYVRLSETPGLPPSIAAQVHLGAARVDRDRGELRAAARALLRALICNPSGDEIFRELRACLARLHENGVAATAASKRAAAESVASQPSAAESVSPRSTEDLFVLHFALAPPPPDHRWRGWSELAPRFALPLRRAGRHPADWPDPSWPKIGADGRPAEGGADASPDFAADDPILLRRLLTSAALVICEDPAAARFCAACDEAALLLPRRSWLQLVANTRVEPIVAPTGHLLDLTPEQVAAVVARACPGAITGGQPT